MDIGSGIVIVVGDEVEVELKSQSQSTWLQLNIYCGQTNKVGCMEKAAAVGRQEKGQSTKRNGKYNEGVTEGRTERGEGGRGQTAGRTNKQATKTLGKTVNVTVSAACQQAHTPHTHTGRQAVGQAGRRCQTSTWNCICRCLSQQILVPQSRKKVAAAEGDGVGAGAGEGACEWARGHWRQWQRRTTTRTTFTVYLDYFIKV